MAILGKLLGEGLQEAGEDIAEKTSSKSLMKAAKETGESTLAKLGKKIPVSYTDSVAQDIAVKAPEMVKVYRGMAAKTDDELKQYLSDMVDYSIKPRTYSGLNVSGEGYNFTTNPVGATAYATSNPIKESRVVLTTELPKNRFIQQNAANQNRLQDFISRAESRGIPYEGGASERAARKDMEAYFKKNGLLGVRNNSGGVFVVNQNDPEWIDRLAVDKAMRGRRSNIVEDEALKNDLGSILKNVGIQNDLKNAENYLPSQRLYNGALEPATKLGKDLNSVAEAMREYKAKNMKNMADNMIDEYDNGIFDWAAIRKRGEKAIENMIGEDGLKNLKTYVEPVVNNAYRPGEYEVNKTVATNFLKNADSDWVVKHSKELLPPGTKIYRRGSKSGISWTTDKALAESSKYDGELLEHILTEDDRYIAPQFIDVLQRTIDNENQVLFNLNDLNNAKKFLGQPMHNSTDAPLDEFSKSVIVDKKGNLLDLYHGTDASFDKFGDIKTEPGYWFTEDKDYAQSHGKNLMTVNLDMRNPIDMNTADGENLLYDLARERFGIKGVVPEDKIFSKEFREFLQDKGYDGLIWDKDGKNTYVAFKPDQIKIRNK